MYSPLDGRILQSIAGLPQALNQPVPLKYMYTWLESSRYCEVIKSVLPNDTTQCPQPGIQPRSLNSELCALNMRSLHLHNAYTTCNVHVSLFYTHHVFTTRQTCNQSFYSDCKLYLKCNNYPCNFVVTLKKTLTLYSTSIIYIHSNQAKYYTKRSCEM